MKGGQADYNFLASETGFHGTLDTLECLRGVPLITLKSVISKTRSPWDYSALASSWLPRVDGTLIKDYPQQSLLSAEFPPIPFIMGNTDNEGTIFSMSSRNVTTDEQFRRYTRLVYLSTATDKEAADLFDYYPANVTQGSPFETGTRGALTPQFKRISALNGDLVFQAPRRLLLDTAKSKRWTYKYRRHKWTPRYARG
ncbi:hypothetical protein FRB94_013788 [Tulasnella sp. JGI-2019a]|nr:hypothetical protein FRB94_013788 [Tulasnella sp. JGI-2019a]KAG9010166.1 hypothetical protein FRB93_004828 [Tulasnella sp. JGI-2019a]